ncbi:threonine/serine dehydratase [Sedimentitalea todarodis]|uniref:Threonine/serine dehydratase n=1 Tax=Sedimentitalea todarodis TaxID=1631240 RepID=A0ABU3VDH8_9RHOB|nr:threonine/serine dehydratase [Sedimentitalea todarodis]MDU9004138.1 threonine/serine dehydratase [Sedimentitalea todarodis]
MEWKSEIEQAAGRVRDRVVRTPLLDLTDVGLTFPVQLKLEQMQHTGSFKARGAFNTLLGEPVPEAGLVAASGGNHGAAVAYAAHQLGHKAHIFVPEMAGTSKIALIRETGADLTVVPGDYSNALNLAQVYEAETGAKQIHAYDAPATVAGQGTCMREWESQGLEADTLLIAVGGGGLIAGALAWLAGTRKVVAVEPETSCALNAALKAGKPVDVEVSGVAANALGARRIGSICFEVAEKHLGGTVLVSDDAITRAQHALWRSSRQLVEPAGATALAALMSGAYQPTRGEKVAVLICGGNIAPDPFQA